MIVKSDGMSWEEYKEYCKTIDPTKVKWKNKTLKEFCEVYRELYRCAADQKVQGDLEDVDYCLYQSLSDDFNEKHTWIEKVPSNWECYERETREGYLEMFWCVNGDPVGYTKK